MTLAKSDTMPRQEARPRPTLLAQALQALRKLPMLPVFVVACIAFYLTVGDFASAANIATMERFLAPLLVTAVGATFVFLVGEIDLSVGSVVSLSSVLAAMVMRDTGSLWAGMLTGLAVGLGAGVINGAAVTVLRFPSFIHTLAMLLVVRAIGLLLTGGYSVGRLPIAALLFGKMSTLGLPNVLWIAGIVWVLFTLLLNETVFGRELILTGANRRAARFNGIDVRKTVFWAFTISGSLAGLAGAIVVLRLGSGGPVVGDNMLLTTIAAIVLGGTSIQGGEGGLVRTLTGAAVIVLLDKGLNLLGLSFYDQAIVVGAVVILGSIGGKVLARSR